METLEKAMAPHSSTLAWKIPWAEKPGGLLSMGSRRVGYDWATSLHFSLSCIGEGNGNPLQCSCLENPRDGGAWWAAIHWVTQSRTRLKQLSSNGDTDIENRIMDVGSREVGEGGMQGKGVTGKLTLPYVKQIANGNLLCDSGNWSLTIWRGGMGWEMGGSFKREGIYVWDGWMASLTRWMWVWVNSGSWWWTGRPGVLRFIGSRRVGHDWATNLNWSDDGCWFLLLFGRNQQNSVKQLSSIKKIKDGPGEKGLTGRSIPICLGCAEGGWGGGSYWMTDTRVFPLAISLFLKKFGQLDCLPVKVDTNLWAWQGGRREGLRLSWQMRRRHRERRLESGGKTMAWAEENPLVLGWWPR